MSAPLQLTKCTSGIGTAYVLISLVCVCLRCEMEIDEGLDEVWSRKS